MLKQLNEMTYAELKELCHKENIHGYSKFNKAGLVNYIKIHKLNIIISNGVDQLLNM